MRCYSWSIHLSQNRFKGNRCFIFVMTKVHNIFDTTKYLGKKRPDNFHRPAASVALSCFHYHFSSKSSTRIFSKPGVLRNTSCTILIQHVL